MPEVQPGTHKPGELPGEFLVVFIPLELRDLEHLLAGDIVQKQLQPPIPVPPQRVAPGKKTDPISGDEVPVSIH